MKSDLVNWGEATLYVGYFLANIKILIPETL